MKLVVAAAAFALLQFASALPATAQGDFRWFYSRFVDADVFQTRLNVSYGIPETDAFQVNASCAIGNSGTYALIQWGADVGRLRDGTNVEFELSGVGFSQVVDATVVGQNAEVGITGVEFAAELDDSFWDLMRGKSEIRYRVEGRGGDFVSLRGSSKPISNFLADCANIDQLSDEPVRPSKAPKAPKRPNTPKTAALPTGESLSCDLFGQLQSLPNGAATSVEFFNDTDSFRAVLWLDFDGNPVQYATLEPGQSYVQQTGFGHPWMITDGPGNCLEIMLPRRQASQFFITVPNGDFGPE